MNLLSNCPICGSAHISFAYSAPTTRGQDRRIWSVHECTGCDHQFMNPQPSWPELEAYYTDSYDPYNPMHGANVQDDRQIVEAKQSGKLRHVCVSTGKRLLDVGCGAGWFLRIAKELGAIEQGIEPSRYAADLAKKQGLNVFHGTIELYIEQANRDAQYDVITANHVIEHVPAPVETLRAMKQLLAPGGLIWVAVPNAGYEICRRLKGRWHSSDLPYHLMHFTPRSMAEAGYRAGLKVRHQRTESIPEFVASSVRQYLRHNWKLPIRLTQKVNAINLLSNWYARRVAGEEPELCVRLRAQGWEIWRLQCEMTLHDAAMYRFSQWWRRAMRAGYAFALGAHLHGAPPERHWVWETRRSWIWGIWLPLACVATCLLFPPWGLAAWLVYPAQIARQAFRNSGSVEERGKLAFFQVLARFAEAVGQLKFLRDRAQGAQSKLIEYKS